MIARRPAERAEAVMSRADKDCAMTEQDAVAADELQRFSQQLVHKAQFKSVRFFTAGSHVELPQNHLSMQACGLKVNTEDVDCMHYLLHWYAFPLTRRVPDTYVGAVIRIYTDGVHPGYARLLKETTRIDRTVHHDQITPGAYAEMSGPAERFRQLARIENDLARDNADDDIIV